MSVVLCSPFFFVFRQTSKLGSFLDPIADKMMIMCTSTALAMSGGLPWMLVSLWLLRDVTLLQGAAWHRWRSIEEPKKFKSLFAVSPSGMQVEASRLSKYNTVLQVGLISFSLLCGASPVVQAYHGTVSTILVPLVAATTWWSGWQYYRSNPFMHLVSHGVSQQRERFMSWINFSMLMCGLGLFGAIIWDCCAY